MNIAVIIDSKIQSGGGFQYALSISLLLNKKRSEKYNFIFFTTAKENITILEKNNIKAVYLNFSKFDLLLGYLRTNIIIYQMLDTIKICRTAKIDRILKKYNIDLIYFISPSWLSQATENFNYIFTMWDLCHRDFVEFPEVYAHREFERRENLYRKALPKAVKIIAESDLGRSNIITRYNIDEKRVLSLPMPPSNSVNISEEVYNSNHINIKKKYGIDGEYIFYPAQFWPHKNHLYVLEGLKILDEKYNIKLNAVFSGSDYGNLEFLFKKVKELELEGRIYFIGFVANEEIPYLYKQALALVMPTYFGPTNIPPLEAFKLKCPVLYSDLPGLKEQVQDAALLLDLKEPQSLAENLLKIMRNDPEVSKMVLNGANKVAEWDEDNFFLGLKEIFDDYAVKLKCWK
ncbi:MAG: glycosyltransferase family 4 protein [Methanococcaceae archaeon]